MNRELNAKNIKYGQLVEVANLTGDKSKPYSWDSGYHSGMKVHFFNKKGVLLGNIYEFVSYDRIRSRPDGIVYERHFMQVRGLDGNMKYRSKWAEGILMGIYKLKCDIITYLMRRTQHS